jgi:hypothetical protein
MISSWVYKGATKENGAPEDLEKCREYRDDLKSWNARNSGCFAKLNPGSGQSVDTAGKNENITYHV